VGEFELIRKIFYRGPSRKALLGIGDDCALIDTKKTLAVSSDMLIAGRHFLPADAPYDIGAKALAVNLSDLAAMGASPLAFTLSLALPSADAVWLEAFAKGLFEMADRYGCELIGGDTTRTPDGGPLTISITVMGELNYGGLQRSAAQPGDHIWVSGSLGGPARALELLLTDAPLGAVNNGSSVTSQAALNRALERLHRPEPRVELGLSLKHLARAAIDISDGLSGDIAHIAEQSRLRAEIDVSKLPFADVITQLPDAVRLSLALTGGDDYELAFTADPSNRQAIEALSETLWQSHGYGLTLIGRMHDGQGVDFVDEDGRPVTASFKSFEHF
jgi:thiamine-monophosphate kinase